MEESEPPGKVGPSQTTVVIMPCNDPKPSTNIMQLVPQEPRAREKGQGKERERETETETEIETETETKTETETETDRKKERKKEEEKKKTACCTEGTLTQHQLICA